MIDTPSPTSAATAASDLLAHEQTYRMFVKGILIFAAHALAILVLLAATSHDFWLSFLTPPIWKSIHMAIYGAYALAGAEAGIHCLVVCNSGAFVAPFPAAPLGNLPSSLDLFGR